MHSRYEHRGVTWVDLESPTREEVQDIIDEFGIDALTAQELLLPSTKPHAEHYHDYIYLVLHFPAVRHTHKSREQEIDFLVGRNFLVTTHYDTVDPLHTFSKAYEVNALLDRDGTEHHAGILFFYMLQRLYKSVDHEVEYLRHDLSVIETHIFSGHEIDMVSAISRAARDLLNIRQTIEPHREVLRTFEEYAPQLLGAEFDPYVRALSGEYYRVHNHVMRHSDFLHELRETNNSLLTTKQNETIKTLTIMAFVMLPLSFIAELFAMDTKHMPIIGASGDFWIVVLIMGLVAIGMLAYFKHRKWF